MAQFLAGYLFTFAVTPVALFLAVMRLLPQAEARRWTFLGLCFGIAPAVLSRLLTWSLYGVPKAPAWGYVLATVVAVGLLLAWGAKRAVLLRTMGAEAGDWLARWRLPLLGALAVAAILFALALNPALGLWLEKSFDASVITWDVAARGWTGTMPHYATKVLLGLACIGAVLALVPARAGQERLRVADLAVLSLLGGTVLALLALALYLQIGRPLYGNDALIYFKISTMIAQERALSFYPLVAAAADGTYAVTSHPLGHHGLIAWSFLVTGSTAPAVGEAFLVTQALATLVGFWVALSRVGPAAVLAAAILLLTTPGYLLQLMNAGIDAGRLTLLLFALLWTVEAVRLDDVRAFVLAGIAAGLSLNSHSQTGVLTPFVVASAVAFAMRAPWSRRIAALFCIGAVAFAVGGERYVLNLLQFGAPFNHQLPIWKEVPILDWDAYRLGRAVSPDLWGRLSSSALLGFTRWWYFGLSWWVALVAVVVLHRRILSDRLLTATVGACALALGLLVLYFGFTRAGIFLLGNYRYALSIQPLVAILGGLLVGYLVNFQVNSQADSQVNTQVNAHAQRA